MRTLGETVRLDARTKLLNPKWYEGMLSSGYEGVREIQKRLTNTMGWSATSGMVDNWVYDEANTTFIEDPEMANRLMAANPNSFRKLVRRTVGGASGRLIENPEMAFHGHLSCTVVAARPLLHCGCC